MRANSVASVPLGAAEAARAGGTEIKCLVFVAAAEPVLVVLRLTDRVSSAALSQHLGVSKSRVKLAPSTQLVELCGWSVGSVPPFGLAPPLRTLVDERVAQHTYAVFGEQRQYVMPTPELLRAAAATVAAVSEAAAAAAAPPAAAQAQAAAGPIPLPLPWTEGAQAATLVGVIAQKRKIAALLAFASLVPIQADPLPVPARAAYIRRLWAHPASGEPCEVQLILGCTLQQRLGEGALAQLLKSLKVGQSVHITGRPQPREPRQPGMDGDDGGGAAQPEALDFVVNSIEVMGPEASAELAAAAAIEEQRHLFAATAAAGNEFGGRVEVDEYNGDYYQCPLPSERIHLCTDLAGLEFAAQQLFHPGAASGSGSAAVVQGGGEDTTGASGKGFMPPGRSPAAYSPGWRPALVVGLDAEWQPFSRDQPCTPVSLLQLATHDRVFLIDLQAICCCTGARAEWPLPSAGAEAWSAAHELTAAQLALSALLERLFGDEHIVTLGFGFAYDLRRVAESFPWLPCFAGGGAPVRSHVELALLAQAAGGDVLAGVKRMGLSAMCAAVLGAPLDKGQQCSDWAARPLTAGQVEYAAADVCCLVAMFDALVGQRQGLLTPVWMASYAGRITTTAPGVPALRRSQSTGARSIARSSAAAENGKDRGSKQAAAPVVVRAGGAVHEAACNLPLLMRFLGLPLPGGRKVAAVQLACAAADDAESAAAALRGAAPHFPRGSGVLELSNACLLFVNLPSRKYPNDFSVSMGGGADGAATCEMAWFGGRGLNMAQPLMMRLLGERVGEEGSAGAAPAVLLFCRPRREAYVFCGRLEAAAVSAAEDGGQVRVSWRLLDYARLVGSPHFAELLRLQGSSLAGTM